MDSPDDVELAARRLADGAVVAHGFANLYALTTLPDEATVRATNLMKGRPAGQVGSLTTTPSRVTTLWDEEAFPSPLRPDLVHAVLDTLLVLGPFGFRGPAAATVPAHLTSSDGGVRTSQLIAPGYSCPSNDFLRRALLHGHTPALHITSANRSRHATGTADEPAHHRADAIRAELGTEPGLVVLDGSAGASARYPRHLPVSTSVLALHRLGPPVRGRPTLVLQRHGSLSVTDVRRALAPLGLDVVLGPRATSRLTPRTYDGDARPAYAGSAPAGG